MSKKDNTRKWAAVVSLFLMISKILGFVREVLIARGFGASQDSDIYYTATNGIIIVMGLLGGGLQTTLVPIFAEVKRKYGREGKNNFYSNIMSITLVITLALMALVFVLARPYVKLLAVGFEGRVFDAVVYLLRLGLPMIVFLSFTYVSNAYLQSDQVYGPHALMGIPYNFIFIIYLLVQKNPSVTGLMVCTLVASSSQFFIQIPALRERGLKYKFRPQIHDEHISETFKLVMPIILSSAVYQLNMLIDRSLASKLVEGSVSSLGYASKVNTMVISVFVVAITSVVFPKLAKAVEERDVKKTGDLFESSMSLVALVVLPATVGMMILSTPIVKVLFERGRFDETATILTSGALLFYAPGLIGQSFRMTLENMYYSMKDTRTPMITGMISVGINILLNFLLIGFLAHRGLALATAISSLFSAVTLYVLLRKKVAFNEANVLINMAKMALASLVMGVFTRLIYDAIIVFAVGRGMQALMLLVTIALSVIIYILACKALRVREVHLLIETVKAKFKK